VPPTDGVEEAVVEAGREVGGRNGLEEGRPGRETGG